VSKYISFLNIFLYLILQLQQVTISLQSPINNIILDIYTTSTNMYIHLSDNISSYFILTHICMHLIKAYTSKHTSIYTYNMHYRHIFQLIKILHYQYHTQKQP